MAEKPAYYPHALNLIRRLEGEMLVPYRPETGTRQPAGFGTEATIGHGRALVVNGNDGAWVPLPRNQLRQELEIAGVRLPDERHDEFRNTLWRNAFERNGWRVPPQLDRYPTLPATEQLRADPDLNATPDVRLTPEGANALTEHVILNEAEPRLRARLYAVAAGLPGYKDLDPQVRNGMVDARWEAMSPEALGSMVATAYASPKFFGPNFAQHFLQGDVDGMSRELREFTFNKGPAGRAGPTADLFDVGEKGRRQAFWEGLLD